MYVAVLNSSTPMSTPTHAQPTPTTPAHPSRRSWALGPLLDLDLGTAESVVSAALGTVPATVCTALDGSGTRNTEHEGKLVRMLAVDMSAWTAWLRRGLRRGPRHRNERDEKKKKDGGGALFSRVVGARVRHLRWPCQSNRERERDGDWKKTDS